MQSFRSILFRLRYIAITFLAMLILGILVVHWHPQVAHAAQPQVTVSNAAIRTTTPLTIAQRQTVAVTNVAATAAIIYSDGSGKVIENGDATILASSAAITLGAGQTVTLQFTQPGVYHLMSANTSGGVETITVTT